MAWRPPRPRARRSRPWWPRPGTRVKQAGSAITSGFEKVGHAAGPKITSGFKAVRRHVGFPLWLRFLTASFVIIAAIAGATSASLILYLSDIANALKHDSDPQRGATRSSQDRRAAARRRS